MKPLLSTFARILRGGRLRFALVALLIAPALALLPACEDGEVIEEIGSESITTAEFEDYYETSVELATRFPGAKKSTLYKLICNPSLAPNEQARDMALRLIPENTYEQYRQTLMLVQVAQDEGFLERPIIQKILKQQELSSIATLYLQEKLWERIKISEEDKQQTCEELRRRDPENVGPLPVDRCLELAEAVMMRNIVRREEQKIRDEILEQVRVERNKDFDRDDYLQTNVELYNVIKEEGGCEEPLVDPSEADSPEGLNPGLPGQNDELQPGL